MYLVMDFNTSELIMYLVMNCNNSELRMYCNRSELMLVILGLQYGATGGEGFSSSRKDNWKPNSPGD